MQELFLELPLPLSVNSYWGFHGHRRFLTKKAVEFKEQVAHIVSQQSIRFEDSRLSVSIRLHFRDNRKTDLDNRIKGLFDALVSAGLFDDDSQIDEIHVFRGKSTKLGKSLVKVVALS